MDTVKDIDIQIESIRFVVERPKNCNWRYSVGEDRSHYVLAYARGGAAYYTVGDERIHVKKGNVILMRPGVPYEAKSDSDDPWSFFSVAFEPRFLDVDSEKKFDSLPIVFKFSDSSKTSENFAELYRVWSNKGAGYLMKCRSLILDILYILMNDELRRSKASVHYPKIEAIADMMRENYDRCYTIEELCEMSGLSSSHFRTLFKEITGLSAIQFQNRLKMDRARDLIISGSCNVTEAAMAVGIQNVYYFSRLFRKITGKNPSEYINF